mgnify:CR=1 FL=1
MSCPKAPKVERKGWFGRVKLLPGGHDWQREVRYWDFELWEVHKTCRHCGAHVKTRPIDDLDVQRMGIDIGAVREAMKKSGLRWHFSWKEQP